MQPIGDAFAGNEDEAQALVRLHHTSCVRHGDRGQTLSGLSSLDRRKTELCEHSQFLSLQSRKSACGAEKRSGDLFWPKAPHFNPDAVMEMPDGLTNTVGQSPSRRSRGSPFPKATGCGPL